LAELPGFVGPTSFGLDEMHMLGLGLSKQLMSLINGGKRVNKHYSSGTLCLGESKTNQLLIEMENARYTIPSDFEGSFRRPFGKYTTRAVDWLDITRYMIPSLFVPIYSAIIAKDALMAIVTVIQIALQVDITNEMLDLMEW
jgi:hypothetical protein